MSHASAPETALQVRAIEHTRNLLGRAAAWLRIPLPKLEIRFDLRGRAAGQARFGSREPALIRYNLVLLLAHPEDFLTSTVPHEVAHVAAFARHGGRHGGRMRPHGVEWEAIMRHLGAEPRRCHGYDVSGLSARRLQELDYHCACRGHRLTTIRHRRVLAGQIYLCRRCGQPLRPGAHPDARAAHGRDDSE